MDRSAPKLGRRAAALGVTLALAGAIAIATADGTQVLASELAPRTEVMGRRQAREHVKPAAPEPVAAAAPAPQRPAVRPEKRQVRRRPPVRKRGGVWAVVVGANDYAGTKYDLKAGVADATDVDTMLARRGVPSSRRRVLLEGAASADSVRQAVRWLVKHAGPRSTAVLFFSGHVRQKPGDPDADGEDVDESMVFPDGSQLFDGELATLLEPLEAARTWIGMAACYGAGMDDVMRTSGRVLTAASPENSLAYENDKFNRTYLVEYMVRRGLLEGAAGAEASVQDAFGWADSQIARDYPTRRPVIVDTLGSPLRLG